MTPALLAVAQEMGCRRVSELADRNDADGAASELSTVYMTEFEPLERYLLGRSPQSVRPLEIQFNSLRGDLTAGLRGEKLSARVDRPVVDVESVIGRLEARPVGAFGTGVLLVARHDLARGGRGHPGRHHVARAGGQGRGRSRSGSISDGRQPRGAQAARPVPLGRSGGASALAAVASVATAAVLNVMVISASGAVREILEGVVMLVAVGHPVLCQLLAGLPARSASAGWTSSRNRPATGWSSGGQGTLAATAFLAVYREGAETSLMYQALLGSEGRTESGFLGLTAGLALGIVILALIAYLIRATSVRLPMRVFFQVSGLFLFALAIVFAGNGVFELQNAGILLTTNLAWLGHGLPWVGFYPNLQVVSVQGLLLAGAVLAVARDTSGVAATGRLQA